MEDLPEGFQLVTDSNNEQPQIQAQDTTIGVGETTPEGFILGPGMEMQDGQIIDIKVAQEKLIETERASKEQKIADVKQKYGQEYVLNPETNELEIDPNYGALEDSTVDLLEFAVPAAKTIGSLMGISTLAGLLSPAMSREMKKQIARDVKNSPEILTDTLDAIKFAKDRNIPITAEMAEGATGQIMTGNMHVDALLSKIYSKYPKEEYETVTALIDSVSKSPRSINELAEKFQEQLDLSYQKYDRLESDAWKKFDTSMKADTQSKTGMQFKYDTRELFRDIDSVLGEADATVTDFIHRTLIAGQQGGKLNIMTLRQELSDVVNEIKTYDVSKLDKYEKGRIKRLNVKKAQLQKEIASADIDLTDLPGTLSMEQLVTASKLLSNKMYVKGGAINTNNQLEKRHIMAVKDKVDEYIARNLSQETVDYLSAAKLASKKKYDTFGYNLSGKNLGVRTDANGKILNAHDADRVSLIQQEIFSSDPAYALTKMKKYEEHISPDLMQSIKREYLENAMGLSKEAITDKTKLVGLEIDNNKFQSAIMKMTETRDGRNLTKYVVGEDGFKDLIAIKELNKAIKSRLPNGDFGYLSQLKEAYNQGGNPLFGTMSTLLKLTKGVTVDIVNMPYHIIKTYKFNRKFASKITQELRKGKNADINSITKDMSQWEQELRRAGLSADEINTMSREAGGGMPDLPDGYGVKTIKFSDTSKGAIIDNMDGTISLDLFGIKDTRKGYGTQLVEKAIKDNPGKKIVVDTDMRGNAPSFFKKMNEKYPNKFIFEDKGMISTVGGLSTAAVALGISPSSSKASETRVEAPKNEALFNSIHSIIVDKQYDTINKIRYAMPKLRQGEVEAYIAYDLYKLINTKQYGKVREYAKKANIPIEDLQDLLPTK